MAGGLTGVCVGFLPPSGQKLIKATLGFLVFGLFQPTFAAITLL